MKNTLVRFLLAAAVLSVAAAAAAQTSSVPSSVEIYSTVYSIGVEWSLIGDSNHNAAASLSYREAGGAWREGLPLVRFEGFGANVLAGSVFFLTPATNYEVQLTLSDPDGGTGTEQWAVQTRPEPALPTNGRIFHVIPGSSGGNGSQADPFRGIATAQGAAQPGDILLLHQGNYGGRIEFNKAGTASQYLVWKAVGDGEVRLDGVDISASWVWLEGLTIRDQFYGIRSVAAPANVVIRRLTFLNNHNSIFLDQRGEFWYIADNTIVGDTPYLTESFDGEGIDLRGSSGHTVAHNSITNVADGISGPLTNVDIFGNDIFDVSDDGIEPDGGWINVRIWGNRIHNAVHNGISFQPQDGGPWYIIRNQIVGSVEAPFKFRQTDRFVMLHNTIVGWGNAYPGDAMMCCNEDHLLRGITRNNLWINVQGGEIWGFDTGGVIDWRTSLDYDGFDWGTHPHPFVYAGVSYATLPAFTAGTGLEAHGVQISWQGCFETFNVPSPPPSSVPAQVMTLQAGCPAVDAGVLLPNIDDLYAGSAPDLGAAELGVNPPIFGPRPLLAAQLIAAPSTITSGESTTLSWIATGATRATIAPAPGVVAESGSASVSPTASVTYTLFAENAAGSALAFTTVSVTPSSGGDGTPFNGTPAAVPGTIEAEHFNEGAANVAYRDLSPGNEGGVFRNTGVDIEAAADATGTFNVGWVLAGEWLNYTVAVASTGTYTIDFRVAMEGSGGTFHLEVDHVDKTGPITLPTTGAWQTWTTIQRTGIALAAGQHVIRLVMDTNGSPGYVGNFNWFRWTLETSGSTPYGGTPAAIPGTIEAERFDEGGANVAYSDVSLGNEGGEFRSTDVDIEVAADATGTFNVGWVLAGEWLNYTVAVASTGTYAVDFRVAMEGSGGTFHLEVDHVDKTGPITLPTTGAWQTWTTIQRTGIALAAGQHVIRLVMDTNGSTGYVGNFNWFRWTLETSGSTPYGGTRALVPGTIEFERFDEGAANVAYRDLSPANEGGVFRNTGVDIEAAADASGDFNVGWVLAGEWLNYSVNIAAGGFYTVDIRVAGDGAGGIFHLEVDGSDSTGPIVVPDTGAWQTWTTVRRSVALGMGAHMMSLVMDANGSSGYVGNFNWMQWSYVPELGSRPYGGTPATVPGTIEVERFDEGQQFFAYRDLSDENEGGAFRGPGVDIEPTADVSGDFNVGWTRAGEWLLYTVDVTANGNYTLDMRVAAEGGGGTFHVEVDGVDATGPVVVPNTGSWQSWTTVSRAGIALTAGQHFMRLAMDSNGTSGSIGNFNWIRWTAETSTSTPFGGIPAAVPGTIEAERFDEGGANVAYADLSAGNEGGAFRSTDVDIETASDATGLFNVGWTRAGEWLKYTVAVASGGTYTLDVRVAVEGGGGTFHLEVDGVDKTGLIIVPNTGSWQIWTTVQRTGIALAAGQHVIRLVMDANGSSGSVGNFNWLRWTED